MKKAEVEAIKDDLRISIAAGMATLRVALLRIRDGYHDTTGSSLVGLMVTRSELDVLSKFAGVEWEPPVVEPKRKRKALGRRPKCGVNLGRIVAAREKLKPS